MPACSTTMTLAIGRVAQDCPQTRRHFSGCLDAGETGSDDQDALRHRQLSLVTCNVQYGADPDCRPFPA
jgi:hypothetical protein